MNRYLTSYTVYTPVSYTHLHHQGARNVIPYQPVAGVQMSFHQLFLRLRVNKKAGTHKRGYRQDVYKRQVHHISPVRNTYFPQRLTTDAAVLADEPEVPRQHLVAGGTVMRDVYKRQLRHNPATPPAQCCSGYAEAH